MIEELQPGFILANHYRLDRMIGSGGFGDVWRADDLHLDHPVAVKILRLHDLADREHALRLFESEAKLAVKIDHPNVVRMVDLDCHGPIHYLVMEFIAGFDVAALLRRAKRLPAPTSVRVIGHALAGLQALHNKHIVHRDLKPANILLRSEDLRVKISDFGLAGTADSSDITAVVGTPSYMAPELWAAHPATAASDVFAIGVVLFEMLEGSVPWDTSDLGALQRSVRDDDPPPLAAKRPDLSDGIDQFMSACLRKSPQDRLPDAEAARSEFHRLGLEDIASPDDQRLIKNRIAVVGLERDLRNVITGCLGATGVLSPTVSVEGVGAPELQSALCRLDAILLDPMCQPAAVVERFLNRVRTEFRSVVFFLLLPDSGDDAWLAGFSPDWRERFSHYFRLRLDISLRDLPTLVNEVTRMIVFDQRHGFSN